MAAGKYTQTIFDIDSTISVHSDWELAHNSADQPSLLVSMVV